MEKKYKQLNLEGRTMIQTQLSMGFKPGRIARELGRSASTLSRELKRNDWVRPVFRRGPGRPLLAGGYRAEVAHCCAHASSVKPRVERRLQPGGGVVGARHGLFEGGLLARADCWHPGHRAP